MYVEIPISTRAPMNMRHRRERTWNFVPHYLGKNMKKHGLMMILCCLLPIFAIALFPRIRESGAAFLPVLFCIGMHLLMIKGLLGKKGCHGGHDHQECDKSASPKFLPDDTQQS